ncbi:hypothetical protein B0H10DRAFT_1954729 [Mycena sp. CBHHK59/15]|nr:hypothetical protein B0H10DRAFT_1954729 [Mycena sp. CBHHK59/15]
MVGANASCIGQLSNIIGLNLHCKLLNSANLMAYMAQGISTAQACTTDCMAALQQQTVVQVAAEKCKGPSGEPMAWMVHSLCWAWLQRLHCSVARVMGIERDRGGGNNESKSGGEGSVKQISYSKHMPMHNKEEKALRVQQVRIQIQMTGIGMECGRAEDGIGLHSSKSKATNQLF